MNPLAPSRPHSRLAVVLGTALAVLFIPFAAPVGIARACGCGAYSPADGGSATVPQETALVRTTSSGAGGGTVDVYLSLTLDSDVRTGALLFPVPDPQVQVSAGPRGLFDELERITTPPPTAHTGGDDGRPGSAGGSVTVRKSQHIGPLDVLTLTSDDPDALAGWLPRHGFAAKPALAAAATPYLERGWAFVAVRLRPDAGSTTPLDGRLDPLHLRMHTDPADPDGLVYPMRLSALASAPERVTVFTLSPQPLDLRSATPGMALNYSTRLDRAAHPRLAAVTGSGTTLLRRWDGVLAPDVIIDDFHFRRDYSRPETLPRPPDVLPPSATALALHGDRGHGLVTGLAVGVAFALVTALGWAALAHQRRGATARR